MYVVDQRLCFRIAAEAEVGDPPAAEIAACSDQFGSEAGQIRGEPVGRSRDVGVDDVSPEAAPQFTPDRHPSGKPGQSRRAASCSGDATRIDDEVSVRFREHAVHSVRFEHRDDPAGEPGAVSAGVLSLPEPGQRIAPECGEISDGAPLPDQ
ncbi:hypothetical protein U8260_26630 [Nocardia sp. CDC192]|uniref:hypothetical protein n=1 Tax=Nocardia implantans TaxID=3108168 RepID=UPI0018963AAD|nr:hypothetical protein [Nocardia sp. CDC192]MBF6190292.1 hypothetical protein [Nocardia beijingensis]MEA3531820.1 hypothetical protein [Nocardia sp. CDC192]